MKKMDSEEMRRANGGRWKCTNCGNKALTYFGASLHMLSSKYGLNCMKKPTWCL